MNPQRRGTAPIRASRTRFPLRGTAIFLACLTFGAAALLTAAPPAGLSVDELTHTRSFSLFTSIGSLSADGRWLAYAVRSCSPTVGKAAPSMHGPSGMRSNNEGCSDLWVVDTKTGETQRVSDGRGNAEDAAWSPDGTELAYYAAPDGTAGLWIWDRTTKKSRRAGKAIVRPSYSFDTARPRWMPDGKHVVALVVSEGTTIEQANARIHATPTTAGEKDATIFPGAHVVVFRAAAATEKPKSAAAEPGDDPIRRETSDLAAILMADVAIIDARSGETRRVGRDKGVFWYAPSPNGKWIAYSHMTGYRQQMAARVYDIEIASADGGPARVIARDVYPDDGVCTWSPDGKELAYVTGQEDKTIADVHVIDAASGADRSLNPKALPKTASWKNRLVGLWTPDGKTLVFSRSGQLWRIPRSGGEPVPVMPVDPQREIVGMVADHSGNGVSTHDGGRSILATFRKPATKDVGFDRIDLATGRVTTLREEPRDYGYPEPISADGGAFVVYRSQDARHPEDLWGAGPTFADARQLTHLNPELEKVEFGATRVVNYLGSRGQALRGALLLPAGYKEGTRVPLIAEVYPGESSHSNEVNRFGFGDATGPFNMQMLATRGYAVFFPETPQEVGTPMADLVANTNLALNAVIELGIADPERLGVFGHSYGGYSTIALITQTQRFKGAVMSSGMADIIGMYGELQDSGLDSWVDWAENGQGAIGGTPWRFRSRYIENSPFFYLDRVRTPLLILHGSEDGSVPVFLGGQVFSGLRRLGREVEFRKYIGEGHVLEGRENIIDYWNAVIRWFDGKVKG